MKSQLPTLTVIARPNGSGKSTYNLDYFTYGNVFNFDEVKLNFYHAEKFDSELRETIAHNKATEKFETTKNTALKKFSNFGFETNFHSSIAMNAPREFEAKGYKTHLIFIGHANAGLSKKSVAIRVSKGGHFVPEDQIEERFKGSHENLNKYYKEFDLVTIVDNTDGDQRLVAEIVKGIVKDLADNIPAWIKENVPNLFADLSKKINKNHG